MTISNLESLNAELIRKGVDKQVRLGRLIDVAQNQLKSLRSSSFTLAKIQSPYAQKQINTTVKTDFDVTLQGMLAVPPPPKDKKK